MQDDALHTYDYKHLPDGQLLEILNVYGQRFTFAYDPAGRMTRRALANGVTIERTFDAAGREIIRENLKADGTALGVYTATYDPVGNRLTVQEFDGTLVTHEYDVLYRLVTDQRDGTYSFNRTYTYDEVGNRLTKSDSGALCTYGYDQADQLLRVGPWGSYVYPTNWTSDENGNLTVEDYVGNKTTFTFDTENRLTKVVQVSGYTEENTYSADGLRRVRLAGTSPIAYLWDDHVLLRDNNIHTTLPGSPGGLLSAKVGGDHRFYIPDMQGHVRQVTDVDGDAVAEYQYDAWGLIQLTAATAMAFADWGYTWDGKPGRYYVQQRHLRADLGRWMSVDPVETEPPYLYVADRPTWTADPSGEQSLLEWIVNPVGSSAGAAARGGMQVAETVAGTVDTLMQAFRSYYTPQRITDTLNSMAVHPVGRYILGGDPSGAMLLGAIQQFGVTLTSAAGKTSAKLRPLLEDILYEAMQPMSEAEAKRWQSQLVGGFAIGFVEEAKNNLTLQGALDFVSSVMADIDFFREAGLSFDTIWQRYVDEPLVGLAKQLASSRDASAEIIGLVMGAAAFLVLTMVIECIVEAVVTAPAAGAGSTIGVARLGIGTARLLKRAIDLRKEAQFGRVVARLAKSPSAAAAAKRIAGVVDRHKPRSRAMADVAGRYDNLVAEVQRAPKVKKVSYRPRISWASAEEAANIRSLKASFFQRLKGKIGDLVAKAEKNNVAYTISEGRMLASVSGSNVWVETFEERATRARTGLDIARQTRRGEGDRLPSRGARGKGDVHSEYKILEDLAAEDKLKGEVTIITDRYPCLSCRNAAAAAMERAKNQKPKLVIVLKHVRPR